MLANIFVLIIEFAGKSAFDRLFVVICEGLINAFLAGEVIAGLIIYHWSYFKQWVHVVDFVLTVLCLVFYVIFIEEERPGQGGVVDFELESILLGFRYTFQTLRVLSLLAQSRRKGRILSVEDIQFSPHVDLEEPEPTDEEDAYDDPIGRHQKHFSKKHAMKQKLTFGVQDSAAASLVASGEQGQEGELKD